MVYNIVFGLTIGHWAHGIQHSRQALHRIGSLLVWISCIIRLLIHCRRDSLPCKIGNYYISKKVYLKWKLISKSYIWLFLKDTSLINVSDKLSSELCPFNLKAKFITSKCQTVLSNLYNFLLQHTGSRNIVENDKHQINRQK